MERSKTRLNTFAVASSINAYDPLEMRIVMRNMPDRCSSICCFQLNELWSSFVPFLAHHCD